jgi:FeS assembly SUF system protein
MNDIESEAAPLRQTEVKGPSEMAAEELRVLTDSIVAALKTVYDPEIPADIYELGLIYNVDVDESRFVTIEMTLTAPACPVAGEMPSWVENAIGAVPGVAGAKVNMVFDPVGSKPHVRRGPRRA